MSTTTIRVNTSSRDRLAEVARKYLGGVSQEAALNRLIDEYEMHRVHVEYERLRNDPVAWQEYQAELRLTDNAVGDGLGDASVEYPEYNR